MKKYFDTDEKLTKEIKRVINDLGRVDLISLDIWEIRRNRIALVLTIYMGKSPFKMGDYKSFYVCGLDLNEGTPSELKEEGRRIKKLLKREFNHVKITSNMRYR